MSLNNNEDACPESVNLEQFFYDPITLRQEETDTCEEFAECTTSSTILKNNKTPGSDGFAIAFYRFVWNTVENGIMSIS